jgi:predicted secreted hydrolase
MTRMATQGKVSTPQGVFDVTGNSWLDREWSTSALAEDVEGWDWFSIQLDDNRELMYFNLRQEATGDTAFGKGTYVDADGATELLPQDGAQVTVLERWTSPDSGATYPVKWRFVAPKYGLDLEITARVKDQEMDLAQRYWEGAVIVAGTSQGQPIRGVGYVELTGYGSESSQARK